MSIDTNPQNTPAEHQSEKSGIDLPVLPPHSTNKTPWTQWAIVVLLSILIALSGAQLLGTVLLELVIDYKSALLRIAILLPVLVIAVFLLVKHWRKLLLDKSAHAENASVDE